MARPRKAAHLRWWRGGWYLIWTDHASGGRERRTSCAALHAGTDAQREELVRDYKQRELNARVEVVKRGGLLDYEAPLAAAVDRYLSECVAGKGEVGELAPASVADINATIGRFRAWLDDDRKAPKTTGALDAAAIKRFLRGLPGGPRTRNRHARNVRACVYWLATLRPPLFPDVEKLASAFKPVKADAPAPVCHTPKELQAVLKTALERDRGGAVRDVERRRLGRIERFKQRSASRPSIPLTRLFLLLTLTGARREDILRLAWSEVDLDRGRITFQKAVKVNRRRVVPLVGDPAGDIAPRLVELLRRWRLEAGTRKLVLPHDGPRALNFPDAAWSGLCDAAEVDVGPQTLRQTFCAVVASMGVPVVTVALWQGHGVKTADHWYRSAAPDRLHGARDLEEALGLAPLMDAMLAERATARAEVVA